MLFVANSLPMNGGSTFLIRICKELSQKDIKVSVLVLFNNMDITILEELRKYAFVSTLSEYSYFNIPVLYKTQVGIFLPFDINKILLLIRKYGNDVHVMGGFGLIFFSYVKKYLDSNTNLSVGVYHQNEFMFSNEKFYFARFIKRVFSELSSDRIIFFNENNVASYSSFYRRDYSLSRMLPIGIELGESFHTSSDKLPDKKIVSIGNLVKFKTYNIHMINLMAEMPELHSYCYEIYGSGDCYSELANMISSKGLTGRVFLKGTISYNQMPDVLRNVFLFVGSGTAIIEASSMGIPSVVGVESIQEPKTTGFFSEVKGFSYNEISDAELFLIEDKIRILLMSSRSWELIGKQCLEKSKEFSIQKTAQGFLKRSSVENYFFNVNPSKGTMLLSFIKCLIYHVFKIDRSFYNRRSEGSYVKVQRAEVEEI